MSIKENLEKSRIELIQKVEEKKELERRKVEAYKNKILLLHEKSLKLIESYKAIINDSGCITAMENLVKEEKITLYEKGAWRSQSAADVNVTFGIGYEKEDNKIEFLGRYYNSEKSGGLLKLTETKNEDILEEMGKDNNSGSLIGINEESLLVCDCSAALIWDKYYRTKEYDYGDETRQDEHALYKLIEVTFSPSSINIFGGKKELSISRKNIDNDVIEKAICRAYLNPLFRDVSI